MSDRRYLTATMAEPIAELCALRSREHAAGLSVGGTVARRPNACRDDSVLRSGRPMDAEESPRVTEHASSDDSAGQHAPWAGRVLVSVSDVAVTALLQWRAPVTTDRAVTLVAGTGIRIDADTGDGPTTVYAAPVEYDAFERANIPWWTRWRPDYAGYVLCVPMADLLRHFRPRTDDHSVASPADAVRRTSR
jgi:hypothetical protein